MRIKKILARNTPPVELFEIDNLSDLVVIAGPNGIGKTRLISSFIQYFQKFSGPDVAFTIDATKKEESESWGKTTLDTTDPNDIQLIRNTLQQNRRRRNFSSSILYYESNRTIQNIRPLEYQWDMPDPWEESVSWNLTFGGLANRFQDTLHAIFKKIQNQKNAIASRAIALRQQGHDFMNLEFTDPLDPFRDVFSKLLGPKELIRADLQANTLRFRENDIEHDINALSSGEREVLNIAFDFLLRRPFDCVIFFDEPELHLHPELSAKLIGTLKTIGGNNQFFLCSHSPDIISSSLDDTVVFLTPSRGDGSNQAVVVSSDDESTEALNRLGHSIGVVSLGKKVVLIEGTDGSLDKQTYVHILANRFPGLVLLPSGGKGNLMAFDQVVETVLNRSIWGVDFYMLADRDAIPQNQGFEGKAPGRFRMLSKYHLENYLLDEHVLAQIFQKMEPANSWLCDPDQIVDVLKNIAREHIPYAASLTFSNDIRRKAGNIDVMLKGCQGNEKDALLAKMNDRCDAEKERIGNVLEPELVAKSFSELFNELEKSVNSADERWKGKIPGKPIIKTFCNKAQIPIGRLKSLYIQEAEIAAVNPFSEIIEIFREFSEHKP